MNNNQLNVRDIDFSLAEDYKCEQCGNDRFVTQFIIKRFSAMISPSGNEMLNPIQVFSCSKCEHINADFLPNTD